MRTRGESEMDESQWRGPAQFTAVSYESYLMMVVRVYFYVTAHDFPYLPSHDRFDFSLQSSLRLHLCDVGHQSGLCSRCSCPWSPVEGRDVDVLDVLVVGVMALEA